MISLIQATYLITILMYADYTILYFNLEDIDSVNMNDTINVWLEIN